jgi:alkylation response protein AidB-like acyl-CoA dehydrogenase
MEFGLTHEQEMLVGSVRAFVEREIFPNEALVERLGEVPEELQRAIRKKALEQGLYAANFPESVGGGGLSNVSMALVEAELGKASTALTVQVGRPSLVLMESKDAQIEEYLLPCVRGERIDCFALTEPDAGSDSFGISTRAVADGDDFVINGTKHFISHADIADFVILMAVTGEDVTPKGRRKKLTAFLVDKGTPGFECRKMGPAVGLRGFNQNVLSFSDCRLHKRQILGELHKGFEISGRWLGMGRVFIGAACVGKAERILDLAGQWAGTRKQFGQTISRFQGTSFKFADMVAELEAARLLCHRAAWKADLGIMTDQDAAIAKLFASEMLWKVADDSVQIYGGMGLFKELPIERFWRDARVERIWEGTSEIQRHIISRSFLRTYEA